MSLAGTALASFKWSLLGEMSSRAINPLVFLVLARLLAPEDFGVLAAATVVVAFIQMFWDNGLARALMLRETDLERAAAVCLTLNLAASVVAACVLALMAPAVAGFFGDARIAPVLRVLALQLPFAAACAVMTAVLQKEFGYRLLFRTRLVSALVPGVVSVALALGGWSYWALALGSLSGQVALTVALARLGRWRPRLALERGLARELFAFGRWSMLSGALGWLYGWLDAIVVGRFLGAHEMGLFRTGNTLVMMILGIVFTPMLPVLYGSFARIADDLPRLRDALLAVVRTIALIGLPIGGALFAFGERLELMVFGAPWAGVGTVIGLMGLSHAVGWLAGVNGEVYRAIGKPQVESWAAAGTLGIYLAAYLVSIQFGLLAFLLTRVSMAVLGLGVHVAICSRVVGVPVRAWLGATAGAALATLAALAMVLGLAQLPLAATAWGPALLLLAGAVVYLLVVLPLERRLMRRVVVWLRERRET